MLMDMCLPMFNIYQGTVALNCFQSHRNSWCPDLFQKKSFVWCPVRNSSLSDITPFLPDNLSGLKKLSSGLMKILYIARHRFLRCQLCYFAIANIWLHRCDSFFRFMCLLSDDINPNPGPTTIKNSKIKFF